MEQVASIALEVSDPKPHCAFTPAPPLSSEEFAKIPGMWSGAGPFLCICLCWCLLSLIIPLAILLPIYLSFDLNNFAALIALCVLCGLGVSALCFKLHVVVAGIVCPPALPPPTLPFQNAQSLRTREVKSLVLIVNPHGGGGKGLVTLEKVIRPIWEGEYKINLKVVKTEHAGHAVELSRDLDLSEVDGLCILGGDGSFHELINGFMQRSSLPDVVLGLLPGGTGNSLMKDLGTWDIAEACRRIAKGINVVMDLNLVTFSNNRIFSMNEISWGLVGDVGVLSEGWRWCGPKRYDLCAMWALFKAKRRLCELVIDNKDKITADFATLFVNHTQYFGKGLRACPDAVLDDGLMNLVYLLDAPRGAKLLLFLQLPEGRHTGHPEVTFRSVKTIEFTPQEEHGVLNIDGESYPFQGSIEIQIIPAACRMFVARDVIQIS